MKFVTKPHDITHLTLGTLLHYLGKSKIEIFCRYSADMDKMQTNCILIASNCYSFINFHIFLVYNSESFP